MLQMHGNLVATRRVDQAPSTHGRQHAASGYLDGRVVLPHDHDPPVAMATGTSLGSSREVELRQVDSLPGRSFDQPRTAGCADHRVVGNQDAGQIGSRFDERQTVVEYAHLVRTDFH